MKPRSLLAPAVALSLLLAAGAQARAPELPRELRGRLSIEVSRCRPIGRTDALLEADLVLRASESAVALPGLHCGAYDDAGAPFFLAPVAGRLSLRAREARRLMVRFAADRAHRECGCTVRDGRALPDERASDAFDDVDAEFEAHVAALAGEADALGAGEPMLDAAAAEGSEPSPSAVAPPGLRYERVLAPNLSLRAEPSAKAAVTGFAAPGARIAVDRIDRGWKLARTADGLGGWLPSDAATSDVAAPERMAERLAPLHRALAPGASRSEALCASLERSALVELVAAWRVQDRAVYVQPIWYALAREDREAFQVFAADCYSATRVIDATTGREIRSEEWEAR